MRHLSVALLVILSAGPTFAADMVRSYSYYTLDATTLDELSKQLESRGPRVESSGSKHPGATRMQFTTRTTYSRNGKDCRVSKARTVLKIKVILPRWRPRHKPEADMRIIWDTLSSDIRRHEGQHGDIAKNYARKLEQSIAAIGPADTCDEMAAKVKDVTARVLEEHDRAQLRFDRIENINFEDRFQRLLNYRLQRMEDRQTREFGSPRYNR
jgi:predicted secreted Zn-dependent protease